MRWMRNLSLKSQILIMSISTLTIILLTILLIFVQFSTVLRTKNDEYTREMVNQVSNNIASNIERIDRVTELVAYNATVQEFLMEDDPLIRFDLYKRVENLIVNVMKMQDGIVDILIIGENGNNYGSLVKISDLMEKDFKFPDRAKSHYSEQIIFEQKNDNQQYFVAGTAIYSILVQKPGVRLGVIAIIIDTSFLDGGIDIMESVPDADFFLLDRNTDIYASTDKNQVGETFSLFKLNDLKNGDESNQIVINGKQSIAMIEDIPRINGKIISLVSYDRLLYDLVEIQRIWILIFLTATIVLSILWITLSWQIISPFTRLASFMSEIRTGNLNKRIELSGYKEINTLTSEFNNMLDEIQQLTDQLLNTNTRLFNTKLAMKQSEISALQSQINPHFLYNTLESMRGIAAVQGVSEIRDMAKALGMIFRYSIKASDMVLLKQEIDIVKCFMLIQEIRFDGRFGITYDIHPDTLDCQIPKMILQPVVENAVYHGLEPKIGQGTITIKSQFIDECLVLTIHDDGVGFSAESLADINQKLLSFDSSTNENTNSSVGLYNVNNRIKLIYGEKYGVRIESSQGLFSQITISLPCRGDQP